MHTKKHSACLKVRGWCSSDWANFKDRHGASQDPPCSVLTPLMPRCTLTSTGRESSHRRHAMGYGDAPCMMLMCTSLHRCRSRCLQHISRTMHLCTLAVCWTHKQIVHLFIGSSALPHSLYEQRLVNNAATASQVNNLQCRVVHTDINASCIKACLPAYWLNQ